MTPSISSEAPAREREPVTPVLDLIEPSERGHDSLTCVLVVPDGMGLRNFVHSGFRDCFSGNDRLIVWHGLPDHVVESETDHTRTSVEFQRLPPYRETIPERVLRQAKIYGQLYWRREPGTDFMLNGLRTSRRLVNRVVAAGASVTARVAGRSAAGVARVDAWHQSLSGRPGRLRSIEHALAAMQADVVFCTHQRASRAVPVMLAARRLGIPTATFIYSWDNLPKGRMAVHADHFLVWSDHMQRELLDYYPELDRSRVHVVGTPQFESYFAAHTIESRQTFLAGLGLDPSRPVICFSGDDFSSSPHDPVYLDDLASAVEGIDEARRPQIIFRRCPVDVSPRYQWVLDRHPHIVISEPLWRDITGGDWTGIVPTSRDAVLLANLVRHSDLVINVGSTMAMDFAIVGKPGIFLTYEPVPPASGATWTAREIYQLPHLKSVFDFQPVYLVRTREELAPVLMHALAHPGEKKAARDRWVEHHVLHPLDRASRRCYQALQLVARNRISPCTSDF